MWFVNTASHRDSAFSGPVLVAHEATHAAQGVKTPGRRDQLPAGVSRGPALEARPVVWDTGPSSNHPFAELEMGGIQVSSTVGLSRNSGPSGMFFPVQHVPL